MDDDEVWLLTQVIKYVDASHSIDAADSQ